MQTFRFKKGDERPLTKVVGFLSSLSKTRAWVIEVKEDRPKRTDAQNRYLWGVCYPTIIKHLEGWEAEDVHEYCLGECFGWETIEGLGKRRLKPLRRSSAMNVIDFMDYVAWIQREMAGRGIYVPDPNEDVQ